MIAAAQVGAHNSKRSSYGNSMIIDPWGIILAHVSEDRPGYAIATVDFDYLNEVRKRLPIWNDRKPEIYGHIVPAHKEFKSEKEINNAFNFGNTAVVQPYQIFCTTSFSIAFINHRPVLPGHVLVSSLRSGTKRLSDLTQAEIFDLFSLVQKVQNAIETIHGTNSSTIAIQDGIDAGQSIEHLHVHIIPRKSTDFGGKIDEIYVRLQQHDKSSNLFDLRYLTIEEMTAQCNVLREMF